MEKKLTNSGQFRKSTDKQSIYPFFLSFHCKELTANLLTIDALDPYG